jgi:ATP-dependent DNA helicase RecG
MAPTEILASQHFKGISKMLEPFGVITAYLTGKESFVWRNGKPEEIKKKELLLELEFGQINILIGTHALISKAVVFSKLALVILDEQHRFGVSQRRLLKAQSEVMPHVLTMTATPIPRSLALVVYGELDVSIIDELPPGRQAIETKLVAADGRQAMEAHIDELIQRNPIN